MNRNKKGYAYDSIRMLSIGFSVIAVYIERKLCNLFCWQCHHGVI